MSTHHKNNTIENQVAVIKNYASKLATYKLSVRSLTSEHFILKNKQ